MSDDTAIHRVPTRREPSSVPRVSRRPYLVSAMPDDTEFLVVATDESTVRAVIGMRRAIKNLPPGIPAITPLGAPPRGFARR